MGHVEAQRVCEARGDSSSCRLQAADKAGSALKDAADNIKVGSEQLLTGWTLLTPVHQVPALLAATASHCQLNHDIGCWAVYPAVH